MKLHSFSTNEGESKKAICTFLLLNRWICFIARIQQNVKYLELNIGKYFCDAFLLDSAQQTLQS